jgi:membrane associated rhomboid family serine protease
MRDENSQLRLTMLLIAGVLVMTLISIAINLTQNDDRSPLGSIGLWGQVVGAVVMIVGLGLMLRQRRRGRH